MNFIVRCSERKWSFGGENPAVAAMLTAVVALCLCADLKPALARKHARSIWGQLFEGPPKLRGTLHAAKVPLPKPRPAEAPQLEEARGEPEIPPAKEAMQGPLDRSGDQMKAVQPPQPSPCRQALTEDIAIAPSVPAIHGPGACGGDDVVQLTAIVLPDKGRVTVSPAAMLRCPMARAVADWVRADIAPLLIKLGSEIRELDQLDSFECRGRNGVKGAPLSEHGRANALDVQAFKLANGRSIGLTDRNVARELREDVLHAACTRFTTVLGPGSDWYHEDHIHLDLMERRNNYKIDGRRERKPVKMVQPQSRKLPGDD